MKKMDRLVNLIKIGLMNKKSTIQTKVEKKEINILKILITFAKKLNKNTYVIKINENFKLKIKNFFKKKKITIKSNEKKYQNKIILVSNSLGINLLGGGVGGILLWSVSF